MMLKNPNGFFSLAGTWRASSVVWAFESASKLFFEIFIISAIAGILLKPQAVNFFIFQ